MTSARKDVEEAITDLISAKAKIKELEECKERQSKVLIELLEIFPSFESIYSLPGAVKALLRLDEHRNEFTQRIAFLEDKVRRQADSIQTQANTIAALNNIISNTSTDISSYEEQIASLEKGIERLKNSPINKPTSQLMKEYKEMKQELQKTKDHAQFETDTKLSQIREVLGARNRNSDRPHETALQAAKRVMEQVGRLSETIKEQARTNAILRKNSPARNEVWVDAGAYAKLLRDSADLEVIKQKLSLT